MISVTLDSNVWLSGLLWRREASKVIALAESKEILVFTSKDILMEIFRVLQEEEKFQMLLNEEELYPVNVIEKIGNTSKMVKIKERLNVVKADPDDNKILECALSSKSEFLITYDNHLLKIGEYKGTKMIHPTDFLKRF